MSVVPVDRRTSFRGVSRVEALIRQIIRESCLSRQKFLPLRYIKLTYIQPSK